MDHSLDAAEEQSRDPRAEDDQGISEPLDVARRAKTVLLAS
jgi:hypothetical protein